MCLFWLSDAQIVEQLAVIGIRGSGRRFMADLPVVQVVMIVW